MYVYVYKYKYKYIYIYIIYLYVHVQFSLTPPQVPSPQIATCLLMWQYQRWRRRPGRVTPHGPHLVFRQHKCARVSCTITINKANMVHLWYSFCSFHLWCVEVGRVDSWFSVIHSWRIFESNSNFWFQSWLTSISAQPKKGVISAPWGQAAKKKVPLYVAPWRCRNVVLRS